jgi:hypothetical protein
MTTYTPSLRLAEPVPGDPAVKNQWGTILNENQVLIESAITDTVAVAIGGQTAVTLTTANGAADQARPLVQNYTGALTGACTVTLPNVPKIGYAQNSTTGGFNVILTAGAGTTATIPPDGRLYFFSADGATNISLPSIGLGGLSLGQLVGANGFARLPGGFLFQWGTATDPSGGVAVAFPATFGSAVFSVTFGVLAGPGVGIFWAPAGVNSFNAHLFNTENGSALSGTFTWQAIGI